MKLQNLLRKELWLEIEGNTLEIKEQGNTPKRDSLQSVTIHDLPESIFAFTTDKVINLKEGKIRNQFLSDEEKNDVHKNCDAVIMHYNDKELKIMLCELKSYNPKGYQVQLVNTKLFVDYLLSLYNTFKKENEPELKITDVWYVLFYLDRPTSEDRTMRNKLSMHRIEYENMVRFSSNRVIKCKLFRTHQNHISWLELTA